MDDSTLTVVVSAIMAITLLISGVTLFWVFRAQSRRLAVPPSTGVDGTTSFPVRAIHTRTGILGGSSSNSINPEFAIGPNGIDLRALRRRHLAFAEIEQADARKTMTGEALVLRANGRRDFVIRFSEPEHVRRTLKMLPGTIPITEEAATLRDGHAAAATPGLRRYHGPLA